MSNIKLSSLLLLGSCGILFFSSLPVASEDTTVRNDEDVTLSAELLPPPLPGAAEHRGIIYLINLFAVRNKTDEVRDSKTRNALADDNPEIIGPLASIVLVVDEDNDGGLNLDELPEGLAVTDDGNMVAKTPMASKLDSFVSGESEIANDKAKTSKKIRSRRTLFKSCNNCNGGGGGGGYNGYPNGGGGGYHGGGGGYPSGGGQTIGILPILVVPVANGGGGHGNGRNHHRGGGGHHHQPNTGNGNGYYPGGGGYPYGGGGGDYYPARGGGGSYAESQASAKSSSYSNW